MQDHDLIVNEVTHLRKHGRALYVGVPKSISAALNWETGEALMILVRGDRIIIQSLNSRMAKIDTENDQEITAYN